MDLAKLETDFTNSNGPFENKDEILPERRVISSVDDDDELSVVSCWTMIDYNRDANNLADNVLELYQKDKEVFYPEYVVNDYTIDELQDIFAEISFRFHPQDAKGWYKNNVILHENFDGWSGLIRSSNYDAEELVRTLRENDFYFLSGDKLAPFYAKIIHENYTELDRIWELNIPVDVHIRRLTQDITGNDMADGEIRDYWKQKGKQEEISPMVIDGGLWLIGNKWDQWGEEYWNKL